MAALTATQITCRTAQRAFQRRFASLTSGLPSSKQHIGLRPQQLSLLAPRPQGLGSRRRAASTVVMVQQPQDYAFEIFCKGDPEGGNPSDKGTLLDCPFSQRTMLTFEEKGIKYKKMLCDEQDLPEFLGKYQPGGKPLIPVIKDVQADQFVGDSDNIVTYIEQKYPEPALGTPDSCSKTGEGLFPDAFMNFLLAEEGSSDEDKAKSELEGKYQELDEAFGKNGGPFITGDKPCARCIALAPQLYHISVGTARIKNFPIPEKYKNVHRFLDAWKNRPSWAPTVPEPGDDAVEEGWRLKIKQKKEDF